MHVIRVSLGDGIQSLLSISKLCKENTSISLAEIDYQHSPSILSPLTMPMVLSRALIDIIII